MEAAAQDSEVSRVAYRRYIDTWAIFCGGWPINDPIVRFTYRRILMEREHGDGRREYRQRGVPAMRWGLASTMARE